jgi:hypothetical protein
VPRTTQSSDGIYSNEFVFISCVAMLVVVIESPSLLIEYVHIVSPSSVSYISRILLLLKVSVAFVAFTVPV